MYSKNHTRVEEFERQEEMIAWMNSPEVSAVDWDKVEVEFVPSDENLDEEKRENDQSYSDISARTLTPTKELYVNPEAARRTDEQCAAANAQSAQPLD